MIIMRGDVSRLPMTPVASQLPLLFATETERPSHVAPGDCPTKLGVYGAAPQPHVWALLQRSLDEHGRLGGAAPPRSKALYYHAGGTARPPVVVPLPVLAAPLLFAAPAAASPMSSRQ